MCNINWPVIIFAQTACPGVIKHVCSSGPDPVVSLCVYTSCTCAGLDKYFLCESEVRMPIKCLLRRWVYNILIGKKA